MGKRPDRRRQKAQRRALVFAIGAALTSGLSILAGRTGPPSDIWGTWTLSLASLLTGTFVLMAGLPPPAKEGDAHKKAIAALVPHALISDRTG